jgi:hypothetical protein
LHLLGNKNHHNPAVFVAQIFKYIDAQIFNRTAQIFNFLPQEAMDPRADWIAKDSELLARVRN